MWAPLRILMVALWVSSIAGAMVVALLSIGWVSWVSFALSGLIGLIIGVPAGIWTAHAIKREDSNWPPKGFRYRNADRS